MPVISRKVGDLAPPAEGFLLDSQQNPVNLTNCTVRFRGWRNGSYVIDGTAQLAPASQPTDGHVVYPWGPNDLVLANKGWIECHWEVDNGADQPSSYPTKAEEPLRLHLTLP